MGLTKRKDSHLLFFHLLVVKEDMVTANLVNKVMVKSQLLVAAFL